MWKLIESGPHKGKHGIYPYYYVAGMEGPTGIYGPMMRVVRVGEWGTCRITVAKDVLHSLHFYLDGVIWTAFVPMATSATFNKLLLSGFAGGDDDRWAMDGTGIMDLAELGVEY